MLCNSRSILEGVRTAWLIAAQSMSLLETCQDRRTFGITSSPE